VLREAPSFTRGSRHIRNFEDRVALTVDANGRAIDKALDEDGLARYFMQVVADTMGNFDPSKRVDPRVLDDPATRQRVRAQLAIMRLNFDREHRAVDEWTKAMLASPSLP